jgi:hypothetical protein
MAVQVEVHREPLVAVRRVLLDADEAVLAVAFVQQRGVNLLERQLARLSRGRLVTTTVFGSTTVQGLEGAQRQGLRVRVLNPARGTFHPKLYVARHRDRLAAAVGSANLTSGLVANVDAVAVLQGAASEPALRELWESAESWWAHPAALDWAPDVAPAPAEVLEADLLARLRAALPVPARIVTLGDAKPNWIHEITPDGVWVETERSRAARSAGAAGRRLDDPGRLGLAGGSRLADQSPLARHRRSQRQALELCLHPARVPARRARPAPAPGRARAQDLTRSPEHAAPCRRGASAVAATSRPLLPRVSSSKRSVSRPPRPPG